MDWCDNNLKTFRGIQELLNDDFVIGNKVKLSSKTEDGVTYTVSGTTSEKSEDIVGELVLKAQQKGATLTATLLTDSIPVGSLKYEQIDPVGRRSSVSVTGSESVAIGKGELVTSRMGLEMDVNFLKREVVASVAAAIAPAAYGSFVVVGAKGMFNLREGELYDGKLAASLYDGRESEFTVEMEGKGNVTTASYSHLVRPGMSVAGHMKYNKDSGDAVTTLGGAFKLDAVTILKGRLDTTGMASLSYIQTVRPNTSIVLSTSFDVTKFETAQVGASLTLEWFV